MRWRTFVALGSALIFGGACLLENGCSALDPGGQAWTTTKQTVAFQWKPDGGIDYRSVGSQEAALLIAEGQVILDENGELSPESKLTHLAIFKPSAAVAGKVGSQAFSESTQQWNQFYQALPAMIPLLSMMPGTQQPVNAAPAQPDPAIAEALAAIAARLDALEAPPP